MTTRSMQKKKSLVPCKLIESLPNLSSLSGLLVQAIASCKSDDGLNFPELKKMLSGQGYDVTRRCPNIKRKLHAMASKGALVRMTNNDGSTLFVIRKHPEKMVASRIFEGSKQAAETKLEGAERRQNVGNSAKTKGLARQAKSSSWKSGEASGRLQNLDKKLKQGDKQQGQPTSRSGSAKRPQSLIKKNISTTKSQHSGISTMSTRKSPSHSHVNPADTAKRSRNIRSRSATTAKKLPSSVSTLIPTRSRLSASNIKLTTSVKRTESPYSKATLSEKKPRHCRSKTAFPTEGQRHLRKKTTASLQDHRPTAVAHPALKPRRRP